MVTNFGVNNEAFTSSAQAGEHMGKVGHTSDRHLLEPVSAVIKI